MRFSSRLAVVLIAALLGCLRLSAQTPRVYLKFDGNLTDTSSAGIITSVSLSAGFLPTYTTDRNGVANSALTMPGSASLELSAAALPADSNTALGLRGGAGGSPFTLSAWVYATNLSAASSYNVIFGNTGTGAGTLHAGFLNNRAHLGFETNDATGAAATIDQQKWYHVAFVYDGTSQRVYVNGIPEITRAAANTLKVSNVLIGNWNTATNNINDLIGRLDDVAIYNAALNIGQVQALFRGVDSRSLPATYSAQRLVGPFGTAGFWGVREIKGYLGITLNSLVYTDRVINSYAVTPAGTVFNYSAPVSNHIDPEGAGLSGYFASEANFGANTAGNDDNFAMLAKGSIRISVEDGRGGFVAGEEIIPSMVDDYADQPMRLRKGGR